MISKADVFDYGRFYDTLIQITKDQTGLTMVNQHNTGNPPKFPYATFHAFSAHQRVTSDVIHGHRESMIIPVSLEVHAEYDSDGATYAEMLLMAFQSQPANYALHQIECGIQSFNGVSVQSRTIVIGGMTYDNVYGFDLNFTAMNPHVEDVGNIQQVIMNKDTKQPIDIEEDK